MELWNPRRELISTMLSPKIQENAQNLLYLVRGKISVFGLALNESAVQFQENV
jgi:hypothetical protein